jgi:hypothetical protein
MDVAVSNQQTITRDPSPRGANQLSPALESLSRNPMLKTNGGTNRASAAQRRNKKARYGSAGKAKLEETESASADATESLLRFCPLFEVPELFVFSICFCAKPIKSQTLSEAKGTEVRAHSTDDLVKARPDVVRRNQPITQDFQRNLLVKLRHPSRSCGRSRSRRRTHAPWACCAPGAGSTR